VIAFFDLDKTLLAVNSAKLWIRRELRDGYISRVQALRAAGWVAAYGLGFSDIEKAIGRAIATLEGQREEEINARTLAFYEEDVAPTYRPGAAAALDEHREKGDLLVLLTSSSNYLSAPVAEHLGLDGYLCTRFEVVDGVFTGQPRLPLCYGPGKIDHARAFASERGVSLDDCAFYTDSHSDLPMLEVVGAPRVVHPDPRLARVAAARDWPVLDWGGLPDA
jgi:HAD superfamily hydrolase (TIGR01490 family)